MYFLTFSGLKEFVTEITEFNPEPVIGWERPRFRPKEDYSSPQTFVCLGLETESRGLVTLYPRSDTSAVLGLTY